MNTYAELYGNIKKRPLKRGLDNKLIIGGVSSLGSGLGVVRSLEEAGLLENSISEVKEFMFKDISDSGSLLAGLDRTDSLFDTRSLTSISPTFDGITMPSL